MAIAMECTSAAARSWWLLGHRMSGAAADAISLACTASRLPGARPVIVACANVHSLATASRDALFTAALSAATYVTADGAPVRLAGRLLGEPVGPRVTGYDLFERVMVRLAGSCGRAMFVGSVPEVLAAIRARSACDFPGVTVDGFAPPFGDLDGAPTADILARIDSFRPDVVFIGMSAPKQEKWAAANAPRINAGAVLCLGAVFDYYAGTLRRAPAWMRRMGCEWCFRLAQEPRRVWRKYLVSGPIFARLVWRDRHARRTRVPAADRQAAIGSTDRYTCSSDRNAATGE